MTKISIHELTVVKVMLRNLAYTIYLLIHFDELSCFFN